MIIQEYPKKIQHLSALLDICSYINRQNIKYLSTEKLRKSSKLSLFINYTCFSPFFVFRECRFYAADVSELPLAYSKGLTL